jgi:hypothetical protein
VRAMMVQGAHYILGPFEEDSDLRRRGLKLAERGGKNAKKRAVVAVARKLAILLHRLWVASTTPICRMSYGYVSIHGRLWRSFRGQTKYSIVLYTFEQTRVPRYR